MKDEAPMYGPHQERCTVDPCICRALVEERKAYREKVAAVLGVPEGSLPR